MLVAAEFPEGVRYAASVIPNLTLHAYKISFAFERATIWMSELRPKCSWL
jgi:hypothetical protein